jgi:hypothetical protein
LTFIYVCCSWLLSHVVCQGIQQVKEKKRTFWIDSSAHKCLFRGDWWHLHV